MTDKRPRLHPSHQHQWTDADPALFTGNLVRCTVCTFTVPRNLANLDGVVATEIVDVPAPRYLETDFETWADVPVTDQGDAT